MYRAYDNETGIEVAWNVIQLERLPEQEIKRILDEVSILSELQHPNIIHMIKHWYDKEKKSIIFITELLKGGTIKQYLSTIERPNLGIIKQWCKDILKGIMYLHTLPCPVLHRDIKCDNIFINSGKGEIRIGDLGLSCKLKGNIAKSIVGTPEFMSPEMLSGKYNEKCDIYAYGMTILEMITNHRPYNEFTTPGEIYHAVTNGVLPLCLEEVANIDAYKFITMCIGPASQRPSATELINHK